MKKLLLLPILSLVTLTCFIACEKEKHDEVLIEENYDRTIQVNESATFTLPESEQNFSIISEAEHAYVSKIGEDLSGNSIYMYTPEKDYSGTDRIVLSNEVEKEKGHHGKKGHHSKSGGGDCGSKSSERLEYLITIRLVIEKANSTNPSTELSKSN